MYTGINFYFVFLSILCGTWIPAHAKIADACHGALRDQTTNELSCSSNLNICLTDVYFYQWHINDQPCPHTINKLVYTRCCQHNPARCFWAAPFDDVRALQRDCDKQAWRQAGRCKLHSVVPGTIRSFLCTADNIVLSTTSSVRSIHYLCVSGRCPKLTTLLSEPVGYHNVQTGRGETTTTRPRRDKNKGDTLVSTKQTYPTQKNGIPTKTPPLPPTSSGTKGRVNSGTVSNVGSPGRTTPVGSGLSPLEPDTATTLATARIVAIDRPKDSGVGVIIGWIFGGIIICLILLGAFFLRRRIKRKITEISQPPQSNVVVLSTQHYEDMGPTYVNTSVAGSTNSIGSFDSADSGQSLHLYASIESFRRTTPANFKDSVSQNDAFSGGTENFLRRTSAKSSGGLVAIKTETATGSLCVVPKRLRQSETETNGYDKMPGGAFQTVTSTAHNYDHVLTIPRSSHAGHSKSISGSVSRPLSVVGGAYDRLDRNRQSVTDESSTDANLENPYNTLKPTWKR